MIKWIVILLVTVEICGKSSPDKSPLDEGLQRKFYLIFFLDLKLQTFSIRPWEFDCIKAFK